MEKNNNHHDEIDQNSEQNWKDRFADVALRSADWFWEMDADLKFTYQSHNFENVTGIKRDAVIGKSREEAFAGLIDSSEKWLRQGSDLNAQKPYSMIWTLIHPSGKRKILLTRGHPIYSLAGEFEGFRGIGNDITGMLASRDTLDLMQDRLSDFTRVAADWLWEIDADLKLNFFSADVHPILNIHRSKLRGMHASKLLGDLPQDSSEMIEYLNALDRRDAFEFELTFSHADGTGKTILVTGKPMHDSRGNFAGYRCVGRDMTELRFVSQRLLERERLFREVVENVTDIISVTDDLGNIQYENQSASEILGYSNRDRGNMKVGEVVHPDDRETFLENHDRAVANPGLSVNSVFRAKHKSGSWRVLESNRQSFLVGNGDTKQVVVHSRDVTSQHEAEIALRQSEERFRDFAETAADWFWEQDENLCFTFISERFFEHFDVSLEDVIGKTREEAFKFCDFTTENWKQTLKLASKHEPINAREAQFKDKNGTLRTFCTTGKPIFDSDGRFQGYRGSARDITTENSLSLQLRYQASHDSLTGLVNRREFESRLTALLTDNESSSNVHSLCYLDLDRFKIVNDTCGHIAGDNLLRQFASLLRDSVRKHDTIARLGGDEFAVLLNQCPVDESQKIAEKIRKRTEAFNFFWAGDRFTIGVSIGVIQISGATGNMIDNLQLADNACYSAKRAGRNNVHVIKDNSQYAYDHRRRVADIAKISKRLDGNRMRLFVQQICSLNDKEHLGYEILLRILNEDGTYTLPRNFIESAERYHLSKVVDQWVISETLTWLSVHSRNIDSSFSVNLSGNNLASDDFLDFIVEKFEGNPDLAHKLVFEITETSAIENFSNAGLFINELSKIGCRFSLDDFGKGFSSFSYLRELPVDYIKIDQQFVRNIAQDNKDLEMLKSINDIGHVMGKKTIAQGVEDEMTAEILKNLGVDYVQGYFICLPEPLSALESSERSADKNG
ncbi:MAG: EAL domain-containing protein [Pseudomonadota bacterium]